MFYSKQPLPRVFCALPPIVPTSCVKTVAMWMYCLYWFNHPDFFRCFLAWKVNIQLTLCSAPSSLFLASSVLFLQSCLHHASRLWQCGCIVFIDSTTQTFFAAFWHEKSTFNWHYVLLQAASSSRLLCSSSNRAYIMRQDCGNVDVLSLLIQSPRLSSLFFGMKSQHSTDSMFYSFLLQAASFSRLLCSSSNRAYIMRQDSGNVDVFSELIQPPRLSSLFFGMKSQHSTDSMFYSFLLQAASSSRLLCSSSSFAYMVCQDCGNADVLSSLIQSIRLSSLFFGMKSQHSTDSMFYSSSLFLASSVLFLQFRLHGAPRLAIWM